MLYHLLGNYGNAAVETFLRDAVNEIRGIHFFIQNYQQSWKALETADAVWEAAKSALVKIEARQTIQGEEEEFGEVASDLGAEVVGGAAHATPADQFSGDL